MEVWKNIEFADGYMVSNFGRIKSLPMCYRSGKNGVIKKEIEEKIIHGSINKRGSGYIQVTLGKKNRYYVHRLVALHFIDNPSNKPCVNHKDMDTLNNNVSNLEWITNSENIIHGLNFRNKVLNGKMVINTETGVYYDSITEAYKSLKPNICRDTFTRKINKNIMSNFILI